MIIRGTVSNKGEANILLQVHGPLGTVDVSVLIDTGFTGSITLPAAMIASLGLQRRSRGSAYLADGSEQEFNVYTGTISWGDSRREVLVSELGNEPLAGMRLLRNHELRIRVVPGGTVEVSPLTPDQ